jgi:hypothetical protein
LRKAPRGLLPRPAVPHSSSRPWSGPGDPHPRSGHCRAPVSPPTTGRRIRGGPSRRITEIVTGLSARLPPHTSASVRSAPASVLACEIRTPQSGRKSSKAVAPAPPTRTSSSNWSRPRPPLHRTRPTTERRTGPEQSRWSTCGLTTAAALRRLPCGVVVPPLHTARWAWPEAPSGAGQDCPSMVLRAGSRPTAAAQGARGSPA